MEVGGIFLGVEHIEKRFEGFLFCVGEAAHQFKRGFRSREIREASPQGECETVNHGKVDMVGVFCAPAAKGGQHLSNRFLVVSA